MDKGSGTYHHMNFGSYAFKDCSALKKATFPSLEALLSYSFSNSDSNPISYAKHAYIGDEEITDVVVPSSVTALRDYTFCNCEGLTSLKIHDNVLTIGSIVNYYCKNFKKVEFPSIEYMCSNPFGIFANNPLLFAKHLYIDGKEITELVIPNTVTKIGRKAFEGGKYITSVVIPNTVTSIDYNAFYSTGLTSVEIPSSVTKYDYYIFYQCSDLQSATLPDNMLEIPYGMFSGCSKLTNIIIPENVTKIGSAAFQSCSKLNDITIPDHVTEIADYAFNWCRELTSINIPRSVTTIKSDAFTNCSKLTDVYTEWITPPAIGTDVFSTYGTLHVNQGMADNYTSADVWKNFTIVDDVIYQKVTNIIFGEPNYVCETGDLIQLTCTAMPENALIKTVKWSTEDVDVVFVDENTGQLVGLCDGMATIKATATDLDGFSATVKVFVGDCPREDAIILNYESYEIKNGESFTLVANQVTLDNLDKPISWTSSNSEVAMVDNGVVTAVNDGIATITASISDAVSASCVVTVLHVDESVVLDLSTLDLRIGSEQQLTPILTTIGNRDKDVTWTSSDINVATVNNGMVTAISEGTATITASIGNGIEASCEVTVFALNLELTDLSDFSNSEEKEYDNFSYARIYVNENWQSIVLPLNLSYDDWCERFEMAKIYNVVAEGDLMSGELTGFTVQGLLLTEGTQTDANCPYLIRAKEGNSDLDQVISLTNCTVYASSPVTIECANAEVSFRFTGTYTGVPAPGMAGRYALTSNGIWGRGSDVASLKPMRVILDIEDKIEGYSHITEAAKANIRTAVLEADDDLGQENGIEFVADDETDDSISLPQMLIGLRQGQYHINGHKVKVVR